MLGRLLHLGSGQSAAGNAQAQSNSSTGTTPFPPLVPTLESVQEDAHTRNLLFPEPQALYQQLNDQVFPLSSTPAASASASAHSYDLNDDVDLDVRDVRIIIMQDTLGPVNASLLFDSHPAPPTPPAPIERPGPGQEPRRTPASSRKGSLGGLSSKPSANQPDSPQARQGAFDRRGSLHGRGQSLMETEVQRASREYREELATFSSCIFGNSELMAYKGTSTKVHVVPTESRSLDHLASALGDGRSSVGRSSGRSSKLSQSFTSQTFSPMSAASAAHSRPVERKKVLITRLFPVNIPVDDVSSSTPHSRLSDENSGFPFPTSGEDTSSPKKKPQPRQRRTPMYAVVLVVQLPAARASSLATPKSLYRESGSYSNDQDFFPSSYNSTKPSWNMSGSAVYGETTESNYSVDMEDRIDCLTQHWDIVMRTLTHLQSVVATTLGSMLKHADVASPDPAALAGVTGVGLRNQPADRRSAEVPRPKASKSTVKLVSLWPNCLSGDVEIAASTNLARRRIVSGLRASRVITGQGRWGIWRDEAIWASKSLSTPFFYRILTGFLATHTEWIQALCPPSYRRRYHRTRQGQGRAEEDMSLPSRTIIVSEDKMAARRLIFLLSALLPASQQLTANRPHRPSTSVSTGGLPNSPPAYIVPVLREESLRRKMNRRTGGNGRRVSHSRTGSQSNRSSAVPAQLAHLSMERTHERRASDAASIRTTSLAMPGSEYMSRKSSAATTTTVVPENTSPHFSTNQRSESFTRARLESNESIATEDLKRTLRRGESSGHASSMSIDPRGQGSKWGSVISGLWSPRRRESTDMSSLSQSIDPKSPVHRSPDKRRNKLADMVKEGPPLEESAVSSPETPAAGTSARDFSTPEGMTRSARPSFAQAERILDPTGAFESPVKTSINAEDGVIDVDVPFPDYITSFESAISSPSSSGYLSTPGLLAGIDAFEHFGRFSMDGDQPLNAAGWLKEFHPDFALQAIPPQHDLLKQIQDALRSEPTPAIQRHPNEPAERWVDIGSAMIVDTATNSIHHILHRRLVKAKQPGGPVRPGPAGTPHTPSVLPYEVQLDEEWLEQTLDISDEALVHGMDKVIHLQHDSMVATTPRPGSDLRSETDSEHTISEYTSEEPQVPSAPRAQCKTIVLSTLEDIIRDIIDRDDGQADQADQAGAKRRPEKLNVLRTAIQKWVAGLDTVEA